LALKEDLAGKRIKCPQCQKPFLVEPDEEEEAVVAAPRRKASQPPPEDEDEPEERPRRKKKKKQSAALFWTLIGGGAAAVVAAVVILIVVLNKKSGDGSTPVARNAENQEKKDDNQERKGDNQEKKGDRPSRVPEPFVPVNGPWPEPGGFRGASPPPETVVTVRTVMVGDSYRISGKAIAEREQAIRKRFHDIAGPGTAKVGASDDTGDGKFRLMVDRMGPVKDTAAEFAKKIDFGTVHSVENQVITLIVRRDQVPAGNAPPP
jgi:hypothetical protein